MELVSVAIGTGGVSVLAPHVPVSVVQVGARWQLGALALIMGGCAAVLLNAHQDLRSLALDPLGVKAATSEIIKALDCLGLLIVEKARVNGA